jgi:hypothetical protein
MLGGTVASYVSNATSRRDEGTRFYIATGKEMLALNTPEALAAVVHSAMLLSLDASPEACEYEQLVRHLAHAARRRKGSSVRCLGRVARR